jgi:hypothetical protein
VKVEIEPEPTDDERAAILAALAEDAPPPLPPAEDGSEP